MPVTIKNMTDHSFAVRYSYRQRLTVGLGLTGRAGPTSGVAFGGNVANLYTPFDGAPCHIGPHSEVVARVHANRDRLPYHRKHCRIDDIEDQDTHQHWGGYSPGFGHFEIVYHQPPGGGAGDIRIINWHILRRRGLVRPGNAPSNEVTWGERAIMLLARLPGVIAIEHPNPPIPPGG